MAKKNLSKQKKMDTRVNFTPMVDMMMLLITFFMLCTTLAKPQLTLLLSILVLTTRFGILPVCPTMRILLVSRRPHTVPRVYVTCSSSTPQRKVSILLPRLCWQRRSWMPRSRLTTAR